MNLRHVLGALVYVIYGSGSVCFYLGTEFSNRKILSGRLYKMGSILFFLGSALAFGLYVS